MGPRQKKNFKQVPLAGGFKKILKNISQNWIISPGRDETKKTFETTT